jgi:uncharacterized protein YkwD
MVTDARSLVRLLALLALTLLLLVPAAPASARCRGASLAPGHGKASTARNATVCLINRERARRGLRKLRVSRALRVAAGRHSSDMARRDFFAHVSPGGADLLDRIRATGIAIASSGGSRTVGENIAWGGGRLGTPQAIVRAWMHSPGHRANILRRGYRRVGVGVAAGAPQGAAGAARTYTADFAA